MIRSDTGSRTNLKTLLILILYIMKSIIVPVKIKNNRRLIFNEGVYTNILSDFRKEIKTIFDKIENPEVSFDKIFSDVIQANYSKEHSFLTINKTLKVVFVNIDKVLQYHSVESIGRSILNNN